MKEVMWGPDRAPSLGRPFIWVAKLANQNLSELMGGLMLAQNRSQVSRTGGGKPVAPALLVLLVAVLSLNCTGCTVFRGVRDYLQYNDTMDDFVMTWRNHVWASQAWEDRKEMFAGEPQFDDFGEGFRAGYRNVASGGDGCPPPLPPRKYWSWKYSSPEGQAKTAAWFAGFPYGVAAAQEEGAGLWREIQVSEPIRVQYSEAFQNAQCGCGGQPGHVHEHHHPHPPEGDAPSTPPAGEVPPAIEAPASDMSNQGQTHPQQTPSGQIARMSYTPSRPDNGRKQEAGVQGQQNQTINPEHRLPDVQNGELNGTLYPVAPGGRPQRLPESTVPLPLP